MGRLKFARWVFVGAGIWGLLTIPPLYFALPGIATASPPAVTHAEFYFGFLGVTLAWQFAYIAIGLGPMQLRPMMLIAAFAKLSWVATDAAFVLQGALSQAMTVFGAVDAVLATLFVIAFLRLAQR